ncbi:MAG: hypothetical protein AAF439_10590, partial [Pseudomonadota bacterium]
MAGRTALALLAWAAATFGAAADPIRVEPPGDATETSAELANSDSYELPIGPFGGESPATVAVTGEVLRT